MSYDPLLNIGLWSYGAKQIPSYHLSVSQQTRAPFSPIPPTSLVLSIKIIVPHFLLFFLFIHFFFRFFFLFCFLEGMGVGALLYRVLNIGLR